jgi:hypothetical protein
MSIVKAHFDGKVFVPDEPVLAPAGTAAHVQFEGQLDVQLECHPAAPSTQPRASASFQVKGWISPHFNEPLEDFKEYT